jgi:hypothetical protein
MCRVGLNGTEMINFINETGVSVPGCMIIPAYAIYHTLLIPPGRWRLPACSPTFKWARLEKLGKAIHYPTRITVTKISSEARCTHLLSKRVPTLTGIAMVQVVQHFGPDLAKCRNLPTYITAIPSTFQTLVTDVVTSKGIFRNCKHQL